MITICGTAYPETYICRKFCIIAHEEDIKNFENFKYIEINNIKNVVIVNEISVLI